MSYSDKFWAELEKTEKKKKKKKGEDNSSPSIGSASGGSSYSERFWNALGDDISPLPSPTLASIHKYGEDDIAPAKGGNKDSIFKSGGFSDGVDGVGDFFVDLGQTVLGTAADVSWGVAKGAGRMVEGLVDLGTYGVAEVADKLGADEFAEKANKVARYNATDEWTKDVHSFVDRYSILGNKADAVSEGLGQVGAIILTGAAGAAAGLGAGGVAALTTGATGLSTMGTNMGDAYDSGATDDEAFWYGLTTGTLDAAFELLSGGLGKGVKALGLSRGIGGLDEIFAKKLSSKIAGSLANESVQKALGNTVEYAVKAGGEGVEEVLSGLGSAVMKKLTYADDKTLRELIEDENLLEQFVVGTVVSGIAQGGDFVKATKSGTDFVTGHTAADEKVIDKVVEEEVAKREAAGEKLSAKDKNKIYDSVVDQMEKGQIDIDTIESVLGGDTYKAYKETVDSEDALKNELAELRKMKSGDMNDLQTSRMNELKGMNLDDTTKRDGLRKNLDDVLSPMLKDSKLSESYRERERRGQAFEADLSKYTGKQRAAVERAVKSGVLNNTYRSHELVNVLSKIEAEKSIVFDYTNNAKLKESGFAVEGKTVNGFADKSKGAVTLNVQSAKAWQSVVGHEITHVLEGTDAYSELRNALYAYAESKGELEGRRAYLNELYKNLDADIDSELTADLIGDYLFTDKDFINKLTGNRTLFQKIYDEIKYLWNVATGKEKTEIEKVKAEFDRVWKEYSNNNETIEESSESREYGDADVQYSIREEAPPKETGIAYKVFYVKDGKLYPPMVANPDGADTPMGVWLNADVGTAAPPSKTGRAQVKAGGKGTQGGSGSLAFRPGWHLGDLPRASQFDRVNPETGKKELFPENFVWAEVEYAKDVDYQEEAMSYGYTDNGKFRHAYAGLPRLPENGYYRYRTNPKPDTVPWVITGAMKVNRLLSDAEVNEILEKNGVPAVHRKGGDVGLDKFGFDEKGQVKDTDVQILDGGTAVKYSLSTWTPETQDKVRNNLVKAGYETERVDKWIDDLNGVASVIAADKDRLDFEAADNQVMLKNNQEYIKTLDASTLCAKRLAYQGTFDAIQHRLPNTVLTSDDLIELQNMLKEHGYEAPCSVCYVESRRRHLGKFAQEWLDGYEGEYKPNLDEVTTSDGLEKLRHSQPQTYKDFVDAMNAKGSANPKVVQLRTEYRNDIMKLTKKQVEKIEAIGGLRVQSFSDFETPHLLDMMQAVMDMSAKGLTSQAYTKVPNFAWVFGDTGIKINLSLIAEGNGFDSDGNLAFSSVEGMDINEAMAVRDAYSENVGTIIVGANDAHILACMADDRIDYIIPFHRSGWGKNEMDMMGLGSYEDYSYGQNEHDIETGKKVANLYPPDYWDYNVSGKENAERYLKLCAQTGREPKFSNFLVNNGDGSYSLQPDGSTDGYWKTLIDFKMYDNEGNGAKQRKVQPNFNMEEAYRILNEYEGGANSLPVANDVVEKFVAMHTDDIAPTPDVQYSVSDSEGRQLSKEQAEYFKDSKVRDENGNLKVMYHGSPKAGFHKFDRRFSDDHTSFFFIDSVDGAESYSGTSEIYAPKTLNTADDFRSLFEEIEAENVYEVKEENGKFVLYDMGDAVAESDTAKGIYEEWVDYTGLGYGSANYKVYLNLKNPLIVNGNHGDYSDTWDSIKIPKEIQKDMSNRVFGGTKVTYASTRQFADYANASGYDGVIFKSIRDYGIYAGTTKPATVAIAFDSSQIKSTANTNPTSDPDIRYSISEDTDADYISAVERGDTETAQRMVDEAAKNAGYSIKAYHGTGRADRVGNVFRADRATSGPMAYFTDSKDIASNYARDKADTSLAYDEEYDSYYTQFRVNRNGKNISIPELWKHLSIAERNRIKEVAGHIKFDDDYETIIFDESAQRGNGAWDAYTLNEHRGNALEALVDTWLDSGDLWEQEELFLEVLKKVGITDAEYRNPDARYEKVYDTWLKITNPFDTDNADQAFYDGLSSWIDNHDMSVYEKETANADMWDKNNQTPESWLGKLEGDIENGTTHAWTVIPDFVTDYLKAQGYDGIKDKGGKGGGAGHTVWIPFSSEQVKSADPVTKDDAGNVIPLSERFNEENEDIRYSLSKEGEDTAPVGTPLRELALDGDVAPVGENVARKTPKSVRIASGERSDELLYESLDNYPMQTVEQKIAEKLRATQGEIADNRDLRREAEANYEKQIANLRAKYNSKKNKNTKEASKILQSISRLERLKASVEADFAKRISDLEARAERLNDPKYARAMQKQVKMEADAKWAADLLGDTSTWKDKRIGLQYATNTERRNLRDIVRDANGNADIAHADAIDDALSGQYNRDEAAKKRELAKVRGKYAKLNITKAEDAYIQMLGEFRHNPDTTLTEKDITEYYEKNKSKIDTAKVDRVIELARQDYDSWLNRVNAELKKQGMKEIPYRQGYFPHFTETKQNFIQKLLNWKTQDNEIPTSIAGLTEQFKPTKSWQSFDKTRHSDETDYSFMKGFDSYSEGALDWIYHMDTLQKRRAVENHIRFTHSDEGIKARIKEVYANKEMDANEAQAQIEHILAEAKNPLNNFVQDFTTHTNILAGKKNSLDRTVEQWTNRHIYSVMTNVQNRMSANMVLANVRSALTNFIPITQSWAQVSPVRSLQAAKETIANSFKDDGTVDKSAFLTNRLREVDKLYQTTWDKVLDKAGIMFEIVDNFSSQVIWRSKYNQNLADGMVESEAIKNADQFAENVMAGRSKGNEPTLFNAKNPFVKAFTMFQLEVNNQYGYLFKDVPNDLKAETEHWKLNLAKGYTTAFIGAYIYNALLEKVTGSDAALDPIGIVEELLRDLGLFDDDEEKEPDKVVTNLVGNVVEELPFVGGLLGGGRIPISSALPYSDDGLTGFIEDVSEGNWGNVGKEMMNPLLNVGLPVAGGQIKKTYQGLKMFSDEHPVTGSYTDSGKLRFPVEDTPLNRVQAAIFGQYASKNAREYFDNGYAPLSEKQTQEFIDVDMPIKEYREYREGLKKQETLEDKFDYISGLDLPVAKKNILINNVVDRKEAVDLEGYEDFGSLEEFDFATKNPEKYAFAKSVGGYSAYKTYSKDLGDFHADKDENGKKIKDSRKEKVLNYINNLDADFYTKVILYKSEYPGDDTYNRDIVNYINEREDLSYEDRVAILTELGFRVTADGQIYAD